MTKPRAYRCSPQGDPEGVPSLQGAGSRARRDIARARGCVLANSPPAKQFDVAGGPLGKLSSHAQVLGLVSVESGGKVPEHYVQYIPPLHQWLAGYRGKPRRPGQGAAPARLSEEWQAHADRDLELQAAGRQWYPSCR